MVSRNHLSTVFIVIHLAYHLYILLRYIVSYLITSIWFLGRNILSIDWERWRVICVILGGLPWTNPIKSPNYTLTWARSAFCACGLRWIHALCAFDYTAYVCFSSLGSLVYNRRSRRWTSTWPHLCRVLLARSFNVSVDKKIKALIPCTPLVWIGENPQVVIHRLSPWVLGIPWR